MGTRINTYKLVKLKITQLQRQLKALALRSLNAPQCLPQLSYMFSEQTLNASAPEKA
jgi:hypothetical protein